MFNNLMNFSYKRNFKESLGFYLAYFLMGLLLGGVAGCLSAFFNPPHSFHEGYKGGIYAGYYCALVYNIVLSITILYKKRLFSHFGALLLSILGFLFTFVSGSFIGLVPIAVLTTMQKRNNNLEKKEIIISGEKICFNDDVNTTKCE